MVEAIFLLCAISPGYMTSGLQEQYMKQLRRVAPFAYIKTLTRTAGGRPIVAIQLGCGCTKVLVTGTHHANESVTGTLLWELLLTYCRAICNGGTFGGKSARALYRNSMLYCVPLVNPDGADLVAGEIPEASPEYVQAAAIAAVFPQIPFPDGWKANLRGVDLNLNYPASWELAKEIKGSLGFDRAAPRDFPGKKPLDQRETAALAAYTACIRPDILLAYHTQGRVIYPGGRDIDPPGKLRYRKAKIFGEIVPPLGGKPRLLLCIFWEFSLKNNLWTTKAPVDNVNRRLRLSKKLTLS